MWNKQKIEEHIFSLKRINTRNRKNMDNIINLWEKRIKKAKDSEFSITESNRGYHRRKLTIRDVLDVRQSWRNGVTVEQLSEKYNVSLSSIYNIVNYNSYKDID